MLAVSSDYPSSRGCDGFKNALGGERLVCDCRAQASQSVIGVYPKRPHGAGEAELSDAFGPKLGRTFRRLNLLYVNVRHLISHGGEVIHQRAINERAVLVVDALFVEYRADALYDRPAYLVVDNQWINYAPAVRDCPIVKEFDEAGNGVDVEIRPVCTMSHVVACVIGYVASCHSELNVEIGWQRILAEISDLRDLSDRDHRRIGMFVVNLSADDPKILRLGLSNGRCYVQNIFRQIARRLECGFAADGDAARGPGAAAIGRDRAVTANHGDVVNIDAERVGNDLRQ